MVFGEIPENLQGVSLSPIICGESNRERNFIFSQINPGNNVGYSIRTDRYRFTEWHDKPSLVDRLTVLDGQYRIKYRETSELYDYEVDPLEVRNLVDEKHYEQVRHTLGAYLMQFIAQNGSHIQKFQDSKE